MKHRSAASFKRAVTKLIDGAEFTAPLLWKTLEIRKVAFELMKADRPIMKHQAAIHVYNKKWDDKTVLNLYIKRTTPEKNWDGTDLPVDPNSYICLLIPDMTFDQLVDMTAQIINLKAFL